MNISTKVTDERVLDVRFDEHSLIVDLMDGRTISAPLAWYRRLANASVEGLLYQLNIRSRHAGSLLASFRVSSAAAAYSHSLQFAKRAPELSQ